MDIKFKNADELINWILAQKMPACIFHAGTDFISKAIIEIENELMPSKFSHVQFLGVDECIYESTVDLNPFHFYWGVKKTNIWKAELDWKTYSAYTVMFFPHINYEMWKLITASARIELLNKVKYNFTGLFGVWDTIIKYNLTKDPLKKAQILKDGNPFDSSNSMFCSQFVAQIFKESCGIELRPDFNPDEIPVDAILGTTIENVQYNILKGD